MSTAQLPRVGGYVHNGGFGSGFDGSQVRPTDACRQSDSGQPPGGICLHREATTHHRPRRRTVRPFLQHLVLRDSMRQMFLTRSNAILHNLRSCTTFSTSMVVLEGTNSRMQFVLKVVRFLRCLLLTFMLSCLGGFSLHLKASPCDCARFQNSIWRLQRPTEVGVLHSSSTAASLARMCISVFFLWPLTYFALRVFSRVVCVSMSVKPLGFLPPWEPLESFG